MESWAAILKSIRPNAFKISLEDVRVAALSDTTGLVTCVEVMDADDSRGRCGLPGWPAGRRGGEAAACCAMPAAALLISLLAPPSPRQDGCDQRV